MTGAFFMSKRYERIPDFNIGYPLSRYVDLLWNIECLSAQMNTIDAITVASDVRVLMGQVEAAKENQI